MHHPCPLLGRAVGDDELLRATAAHARREAAALRRAAPPLQAAPAAQPAPASHATGVRRALLLLETAGGVASPAPSGRPAVRWGHSLRVAPLIGDVLAPCLVTRACLCLRAHAARWRGPGRGRPPSHTPEAVPCASCPTPGTPPQADVFRSLRLPAVLVADPALGGISASLCAAEALAARGLDVEAVVLVGQVSLPGLGLAVFRWCWKRASRAVVPPSLHVCSRHGLCP